MLNKRIIKCVNILLVVWFLCIPLFWRFDLTKGNAANYDAFGMAPSAIFHIVIFFFLSFISICFGGTALYHVLLLVLYFPFIQIVNLPYLTERDVYLHAAPVRGILANGHLTGTLDVAPSWPGSFDLHAITTIVSGCNVIYANYILFLSLSITLALVLYALVRVLKRNGYGTAWVSVLLFPCLFLNYAFSDFTHYSRNALGFVLLFVFFLLFSMRSTGRHGLVLQLLTITSIAFTHPFQSFALVVFCFASIVISRRTGGILLALFSLVTFLGNIYFQGYSTFVQGVNQLGSLFSTHYSAPLVASFSTRGNLPWWGLFSSNYYKYSLVVLLLTGIFAAILLFKEKKHTKTTAGLSSVLFSSMVMLFLLILLPDWGVSRFVMFAAFPASFSSFLLLEETLKTRTANVLSRIYHVFTHRLTLAILLLFVITLSTSVMVSNFETNYYFGELSHPAELSSLSFFVTVDHNSSVNIVSWRTSVYYNYFDYNASHNMLGLWYLDLNKIGQNSSKLLFSQSQLINQSDFVIRGMRDVLDFQQFNSTQDLLRTMDEKLILPTFNQIYCNGNYSVYRRALLQP